MSRNTDELFLFIVFGVYLLVSSLWRLTNSLIGALICLIDSANGPGTKQPLFVYQEYMLEAIIIRMYYD